MRKLDEDIVRKIRKNYKDGDGMSITKIQKKVQELGYDVTYASVRNVCIGHTWKHVA